MQHRIGRAAACGHAGDGVLERFTGNDLRRAAVGADRVHQNVAGFSRGCVLVLGGCRNAREINGRDAEDLSAHGHGVGRKLAAACARAGTGIGFKSLEAGIIDAPRRVRADAFKHILNRDVDAV